MTVFAEAYADLYDLLYAGKDYAGEAAYVAARLRADRPDVRSVLEFGSGTGRHARLRADRGLLVAGIERSASMLRRARAPEDARVRCVAGDIRSRRVEGRFDAVVALFHVVGYLRSDDDLLEAFGNARRHLEPGGVFLFDFWFGPAVLTQKPDARIKEAESADLQVVRLARTSLDPIENLATVDYAVFFRRSGETSYRREDETHVMRYLFLPELRSLLERAGFRFRDAEEWCTGRPLDASTWNATVLAEAV